MIAAIISLILSGIAFALFGPVGFIIVLILTAWIAGKANL